MRFTSWSWLDSSRSGRTKLCVPHSRSPRDGSFCHPWPRGLDFLPLEPLRDLLEKASEAAPLAKLKPPDPPAPMVTDPNGLLACCAPDGAVELVPIGALGMLAFGCASPRMRFENFRSSSFSRRSAAANGSRSERLRTRARSVSTFSWMVATDPATCMKAACWTRRSSAMVCGGIAPAGFASPLPLAALCLTSCRSSASI
mmetsp:Transcript_192/g.816  ORF Transcript_192/g.816 Transcript_192/m.816 type:complete len:200 (+) Transcript_192:136-735(+)